VGGWGGDSGASLAVGAVFSFGFGLVFGPVVGSVFDLEIGLGFGSGVG